MVNKHSLVYTIMKNTLKEHISYNSMAEIQINIKNGKSSLFKKQNSSHNSRLSVDDT